MHTNITRAVSLAIVVVMALAARVAQAKSGQDPADAQPAAQQQKPGDTPAAHDAAAAAAPEKKADPKADAALLAAMLQLERALGESDPQKRPLVVGDAIRALGALSDARAVPALLRLSRSSEAALRLSAIGSLGAYLDDATARARLEETLLPQTPPEDAAVALPALLAAARKFPGAASVPCPKASPAPEGAPPSQPSLLPPPPALVCVDDGVLLHALLAYADVTDEPARAAAVKGVADLVDPRALPFLWRLTNAVDGATRAAAIAGLGAQPALPMAKARLLEVLASATAAAPAGAASTPLDRKTAAEGLAALAGDDVTDALLAARTAESDADTKAALEKIIDARAHDKLVALLEAERRALEDKASAPNEFDKSMRYALAGVAGVGAAVGSAAASSVVADELQPGSGGCYALWGACAGGASAAAIGWFALGDRRVDVAQVELAASTSAWGAWAGLLVPPTIGPSATKDVRHMVYSAAAGQLIGLTAGTVGAVVAHPTQADVGEMNVVVLGTNALTAGTLLSLPPSNDARPLWGSLIGATVVAGAGGALLSSQLHLEEHDLVHVAETSGVGLLAGLAAGTSAVLYQNDLSDHPGLILGGGLIGAGLGAATGTTLGQLKLTPTDGGLIYESWAAVAGGSFGVGGGLLLDALLDNPAATPTSPALWFGGAAVGVTLGAASTAFFPSGIPQDSGDLMLQPLFVGFGLYHAAGLAAAADIDPRYVGAAAFLTPALVSGGLVYAAPYVSASSGDVLMLASMMGFGAYFSTVALYSASGHGVTLPPSAWVLGTSLTMDAGIAGGIALDLTNIDHVGWRTTYIAAVAAGTTLVVSLPGALIAQSTKGAVQVPDVLLASSLIGVGLGFATMPLIDFRIAPDWGLGKRPDASDPTSSPPPVQMAPAMLPVAPLKDEQAPVALGVVGRF